MNFYPNMFSRRMCKKKPAVCSKFRECAKATRSQKSVASWSRWPYCIFLINE